MQRTALLSLIIAAENLTIVPGQEHEMVHRIYTDHSRERNTEGAEELDESIHRV